MEYKNFVDLLVDIKDFDEKKVKILLDARYPRGVFYENNSSWREYNPLKIDTVKSDIYPYVKKHIDVISKDYLQNMSIMAKTVDLINMFAPIEGRAKYTNDLVGDSCRCNWLISVLLQSRTIMNDSRQSEAYLILKNRFNKKEIVNALKHYSFNLGSINELYFIVHAVNDLGLFRSESLNHKSSEIFVETFNDVMFVTDRYNLCYFFSRVKLDNHSLTPKCMLSKQLLGSVWENLATYCPENEEIIEILNAEYSRFSIWENPEDAILYAYAYNELLLN